MPEEDTGSLDIVAYDSRAHGESDGRIRTYGFHAKRDLHRVLDTFHDEQLAWLCLRRYQELMARMKSGDR